MTYGDWYSQYIQLYKRKIADKTRESYARLHQLVSPVLAGRELGEILPDDIQRALIAAEDNAGSRQAQLAYALLHAVFRRAVRSRLLQYNPVDGVDKPSHDAMPGRAIIGDDWQLLQPVIDADLAFCLMARAGLRRGEVLGLRWSDVDIRSCVIRVSRQYQRVKGHAVIVPPKSSAGVRSVPIDPALLPLIRAHYRLTPGARVVSCSPETLRRRWKSAQLEAGLPADRLYRLHDLRHTFATRLNLAGCNLRVLQYIIGHADFNLTLSTYAHVGELAAISEYNRLAEALH